MKQNLHILVAGDGEQVKSFVIPKSSLVTTCLLVSLLMVVSTLAGIGGVKFFYENSVLANKAANFEKELRNMQVMTQEYKKTIAMQEQEKLEQQARHEKEKEVLLASVIKEIREKGGKIETILSAVGFDAKTKKNDKNSLNSGGPFTGVFGYTYEDLIDTADYYLQTLQPLPLGMPVTGTITSGFGRRTDPFNNLPAFHDGIDIRNKAGSAVKATADGKVCKSGFESGYGNVVQLDHGNGFKTLYAHLRKVLVKKGQRVERGETIGLLGSSGRSTGSHLHYTISYRGKVKDPMKFVKIARQITPKKRKVLKINEKKNVM